MQTLSERLDHVATNCHLLVPPLVLVLATTWRSAPLLAGVAVVLFAMLTVNALYRYWRRCA